MINVTKHTPQTNFAPDWYYDPLRTPQELREAFRQEAWTGSTKGMLLGSVHLNLVILRKTDAFDFLVFCYRNPRPCPIIEVTECGNPVPVYCAPTADLRTDLPKYRIYEKGKMVTEVTNVLDYWRDDLVCFLLGCSIGADRALLEAGVPVRHLEETRSHLAYISNIPVVPAGRFHSGRIVVTMRPLTPVNAIRATQITTRLPAVHGAPLHVGDAAAIGIKDLRQPDYGLPVTVKTGEVPVFWGCGVTPQVTAIDSKIDFMITHAPGHMFVTDLTDAQLAIM